MDIFIGTALAMPTAFFTLILALLMLYWAFVLIGVADIDLFGVEGAVDSAADGLLEAGLDAGFEGSIESGLAGLDAIDAVLDGGIEGAVEGGIDGVGEAFLDG